MLCVLMLLCDDFSWKGKVLKSIGEKVRTYIDLIQLAGLLLGVFDELDHKIRAPWRRNIGTRYHKYARVDVKLGYRKGNRILIIIIKSLGAATWSKARQLFDVSQCFFQFCYRYLEI